MLNIIQHKTYYTYTSYRRKINKYSQNSIVFTSTDTIEKNKRVSLQNKSHHIIFKCIKFSRFLSNIIKYRSTLERAGHAWRKESLRTVKWKIHLESRDYKTKRVEGEVRYVEKLKSGVDWKEVFLVKENWRYTYVLDDTVLQAETTKGNPFFS